MTVAGDRADSADRSVSEMVTISELRDAARTRLSEEVWNHAAGAAEDELTLQRNRSVYSQLAFRPRVLRDVSRVSLGTELLGHQISLPVLPAPVGTLGLFANDAVAELHEASRQVGTMPFFSMLSNPAAPHPVPMDGWPRVLQIYIRGDRRWCEGLLQYAVDAGYSAVCVTVDSPGYGRRERDLTARFKPQASQKLGEIALAQEGYRSFQSAPTWTELEWLIGVSALPVIVKGITDRDDARQAMRCGAAAVYVSNHGGRQLDHCRASLMSLDEVAHIIDRAVPILFDGGIVRGSDVVKALALGADAVLAGRLTLWGLAAGGAAGVTRAYQVLRHEMEVCLTNLGVASVESVDRECVAWI